MHMDDGELRWFSVNARAMREGDGVTGVISTFVDVTEHQNMVTALAESERRFRLLAENAGDLITSIDPQGIRTYVSPSCRALLGFEPDELIGKVAVEIVHPEDRATVSAYLRALADAPGSAEARFLHKERPLDLVRDARARRPRRSRRRRRGPGRGARRHRAPPRRADAARERGGGRRGARRAPDGARRHDALRDHRHRRGRPDHGLQRGGRAHARLPRRGRHRACTAPICSTIPRSSRASRSSSASRSRGCSDTARATRHRHARLDVRAQGRHQVPGLARDHRHSLGRGRRDRAISASAATSRPSGSRRASCATPRSASATPSTRRRSARRSSRPTGASRASTTRSAASPATRSTGCSATTFQSLTHPDDLGVDLDHMHRMLAGESEVYEMEKRYRHADGHYIWALLSVSLVRDEAGDAALLRLADPGHQRAEAGRASGSRT